MKIKKPVPFSFVIDELAALEPRVFPMFGCHALYIGEKLMVILRQKENYVDDNGVWLATSKEHHESLRKDFPALRSIKLLGAAPTEWQNLPENSPEVSYDFESAAFRVCELIRKGDERIGRVPKSKKKKSATRASKTARASRA